MLKTITKALCSVALLALATNTLAEKGEQWLTNMDEAQKIAKAEGKDIFMFFTGSDWCGWCIKLDNEVLSKEEFLDYAKDNLVLVDLDFPQGEDIITEEQREHNDQWKERFPVRGFPTVFLTDASASGYAQTGYRDGGPVKYVEHLQELQAGKTAIADLMAKAAKTSGVARAKLLDTVLSNDSAIIDNRDELMSEVITLTENKDDALYNKYFSLKSTKDLMDDLAGMRSFEGSPEEKLAKILALHEKYDFIKEGQGAQALMGTIGDSFIAAGQPEEGVAFMETIVSDDSYPLDIRQSTALFKGIITAYAANGKGDPQKALPYFDKAIEMSPESPAGKRAKGMKERIMSETKS